MEELQKVDISETWLWENFPEAFTALLKDYTTGGNIYWATDSYESQGECYRYFDEMISERINVEKGLVVRPRALKDCDEQVRRSKDKGEVFTPIWVCNAQNNLVDNEWFGRKDVFNQEIVDENGCNSWLLTTEPIIFSNDKRSGKTWRDYIRSSRLGITCGEAPYLASRYDTTTGEYLPIERRVGILDRKQWVVRENAKTGSSWL